METRCVKTLRPRLETKPESQLERENKPSPSCCGLLSSCRAFPLPSLGPRLLRMSGVSSCSTPARKKFSPPLPPPNLTPPVRHPNQFLSLQKRHAGELTQGNLASPLAEQAGAAPPPDSTSSGGAAPANKSAQRLFFQGSSGRHREQRQRAVLEAGHQGGRTHPFGRSPGPYVVAALRKRSEN